MAVEMKISSLEVYDDSMLVINQLPTHYEVRKDDLISYHQLATELLERFNFVTLEHVPRKDNQMADALANLAATLTLTKEEAINLPVCQRWVVPLTLRTSQEGVNAISVNIINRYGVPRYIITDNGKPFSNRLMDKLCEDFDFKQRNSSMYNAPANGLAEAFNKTLCSLLKKVVGRTKKDWHERINEALWAYRTTYRTPTQATPYSLVYSVEAVLLLESQLPSLRMAIQEGLTDEENVKLRLQELEALDEKRLEAQQRLECYQVRLSNAFNKKYAPDLFRWEISSSHYVDLSSQHTKSEASLLRNGMGPT
ncbi:hypothetical protein L3X38_010280 [Prunus dulcis]|uniref:Integrase catalytic domain-containing protein n=1 Tax=Prunus dulcis TaxID=3755 RepID=A0AAD4WF95_PRUDU|nr:hypothetical protein L3X38_010280 [Prunus dulcis]